MQTRWFKLEVIDSPLSTPATATLADESLEDIAARLGIDLEPWDPPLLVVGSPSSECVDDTVRVASKAARGATTAAHWYELLVRHELTHLLLERCWGMAPTLFWEGIPVHLGDARVRQRIHWRSYASYCANFGAEGRLLPLESLLTDYYGQRSDMRVDVQAGAFCGWLLERDRPGLRRLFETWAPEADLDELLQKCLGAGLAELDISWQDSLSRITLRTR